MPRNPNKLPCRVPGCHSWAMRGHTRCRAHRDAELGPRGGGGPPGNLNALRTGRDAHLLPSGDLARLAHQLISDPEHLSLHLQPAIDAIHARTNDPLKTLIALQAALPELRPLVARYLFASEFKDLLRRLPPDQRSALGVVLQKHTRARGPEFSLHFLRGLVTGLGAHLGDHLLPDHPPNTPLPASMGHQHTAPVPPPPGPPAPQLSARQRDPGTGP
jgi:hypothetical protein